MNKKSSYWSIFSIWKKNFIVNKAWSWIFALSQIIANLICENKAWHFMITFNRFHFLGNFMFLAQKFKFRNIFLGSLSFDSFHRKFWRESSKFFLEWVYWLGIVFSRENSNNLVLCFYSNFYCVWANDDQNHYRQSVNEISFVEQLEYGLDNANPGYGHYNGEELIGNEDDSASWYDSSTNETRIRHQLPLLDGSPSLRKKFFFQVSSIWKLWKWRC